MPKKKRGVTPDGEEIKRLRTLKGLTQAQLAQQTGLNVDEIRRAEAGRQKSVEHLEQIAIALTGKKDIDALLKRMTLRLTLLGLIEDARKQGAHIIMSADFTKNRIILHGAANVILREGSVIVEMDLTSGDIMRVVAAFLAGKLGAYPIQSISIEPSLMPVSTKPAESAMTSDDANASQKQKGELAKDSFNCTDSTSISDDRQKVDISDAEAANFDRTCQRYPVGSIHAATLLDEVDRIGRPQKSHVKLPDGAIAQIRPTISPEYFDAMAPRPSKVIAVKVVAHQPESYYLGQRVIIVECI